MRVLDRFYRPGLEAQLTMEDPEMHAVCTALLLHRHDPDRVLKHLCKTFADDERVNQQHLQQVFSHLLYSKDFFIRRAGAQLLRYVTYDFKKEAHLALSDQHIEVRFSALKSVIHLVSIVPQYANLCIDWLVDAIKKHHQEEEEHFRQVALGSIKSIDYGLFLPLAFQFLYSKFPTFRIDITHDLKNATGFWREVVLLHMAKIANDSKEPNALRRAAQHVLDLLS